MKTLKNLVKTEILNVEELMVIKGAAAAGDDGCTTQACQTGACTNCACSSSSLCQNNICGSSVCSSSEGCNNVKNFF